MGGTGTGQLLWRFINYKESTRNLDWPQLWTQWNQECFLRKQLFRVVPNTNQAIENISPLYFQQAGYGFPIIAMGLQIEDLEGPKLSPGKTFIIRKQSWYHQYVLHQDTSIMSSATQPIHRFRHKHKTDVCRKFSNYPSRVGYYPILTIK